jgi:hypothetical protein
MKYDCGHEGCDICGARRCTGADLEKIHDPMSREPMYVCDSCLSRAVRYAIDAAETFGGIYIDQSKPCGNKKGQINEL